MLKVRLGEVSVELDAVPLAIAACVVFAGIAGMSYVTASQRRRQAELRPARPVAAVEEPAAS